MTKIREVELKNKALYSPIKIDIDEWGMSELPDISIWYRLEKAYKLSDTTSLLNPPHYRTEEWLIGYNIRTFSHKRKEGLEGICFGVDPFTESSRVDKDAYNNFGRCWDEHFFPEVILTGLNQEEVIEQYSNELNKKRKSRVNDLRERGYLVGEEINQERAK